MRCGGTVVVKEPTINLTPPAKHRLKTIDLRGRLSTLAVTVHDERGRPLPRARVRIATSIPEGFPKAPETVADDKGRAVFPWANEADEVWVSAHHGRRMRGIVRVKVDGPSVSATLTAAGPVQVQLPERPDGAPPATIVLKARATDPTNERLSNMFNKGMSGLISEEKTIDRSGKIATFWLPLAGDYELTAILIVDGQPNRRIKSTATVGASPFQFGGDWK